MGKANIDQVKVLRHFLLGGCINGDQAPCQGAHTMAPHRNVLVQMCPTNLAHVHRQARLAEREHEHFRGSFGRKWDFPEVLEAVDAYQTILCHLVVMAWEKNA
jgi:hypothetical protein